MPVYNYECSNCEHAFEEYQKLADKPFKKCPECKKFKLVKVISLPAKPFVPGHPLDEFKKMKQEAKQIAQKIIRGDEKAIADVLGPSALGDSPNPPANAPKPKQLKDVKKGVIKRRGS